MYCFISFSLLATATLGACMPSLHATHRVRDLVNITDGSSPLTPSQAAADFSSKGIHPDLFLNHPIRPPYQGRPLKVKPVARSFLPKLTLKDNSFSAKLPANGQISFEPRNQRPFHEFSPRNVTENNSTGHGLFTRQACDPGYNCCPDPRYSFEDSNYPWSAIGRITFPQSDGTGICGGALVGPHHVLTAAHCVNWQQDANGDLPWVAFEPQHWSGHSPWKYYATTTTYWDWTPHGDPTNQEQAASDYVVLILDVPGGDTGLGYLGARGYVKDWDNLNVFKHVGYPGQLDPNDDTPYSEPYFSINNAFSPENFCIHQHGLALQLNTCVSKGDSGGPVFSWWNSGGCIGPCIVGVANFVGAFGVTCEDLTRKTGNYAAGGNEMVQLIIDGRNNYP